MITKSYLTNTNNNTVVLQYGFHLAYYTVYMIVERLCIGRCFAYMWCSRNIKRYNTNFVFLYQNWYLQKKLDKGTFTQPTHTLMMAD